MWRERTLKVVLVVVGLVFCALAYPLIIFVKQEPALAMQFSVYVHPRHLLCILNCRNQAITRFDLASGILSAIGMFQQWAGPPQYNLA